MCLAFETNHDDRPICDDMMDEVLKRMHALGYYQEMDFELGNCPMCTSLVTLGLHAGTDW